MKIEKAWDKFLEMHIDDNPDTTEEDLELMKGSFYAGFGMCAALFGAQEPFENETIPNDNTEVLEICEEILGEVDDFFEDLEEN